MSPLYCLNSYQTNFVFLSLCLPDQTSKSRLTFLYFMHSCNFFCGDIKTVALKRFLLYRNWKCYLFLFVSLWLRQELFSSQIAIPFSVEPSLFNSGNRTVLKEHHCLDQEFIIWQIVVVPSAQWRRPNWFSFGQNHQRDKIQQLVAEFYVRLFMSYRLWGKFRSYR